MKFYICIFHVLKVMEKVQLVLKVMQLQLF